MVSIQIWVTPFHIHCTGELEQVPLALLAGRPFLSTGLATPRRRVRAPGDKQEALLSTAAK